MQEQVTHLLQELNLPYWSWNLIIIGASLLLGFLIYLVFSFLVRRKAKQSQDVDEYSFFKSVLRHMAYPLNMFLPLFLFSVLLPAMKMPAIIMHKTSKAVEIVLIVVFAWILIKAVRVAQDYVFHRYDLKKPDNFRERKIRTQLAFIRRLIVGLIITVSIAAILLSFSSLRKVGTGLLTGVGLSGIIIGFAAQRSISNLLAGFQIAFTQPIRINDIIVAEGESGTVEEITLTYVVLRIWDERRLVLPINYFIERPFQNWTRTSSELLGTVIMYADYNLPIEPVRQELTRLLQQSKFWDGRVNALHVTDATENTIQVRALMSSRNSGDIFELRCFVRENLIKFITDNFSDSLPKNRTIISSGDEGDTKSEVGSLKSEV
jgi:small-conductance mechanosensitive channel